MPFQILSLSGGGFLGLYTAAVLAELEERSGKRLIDCFDLIAGTSIGGIIALGLSAGKSATEIRDAFIEDGPKIFPSTPPKTKLGWAARFAKNIGAPLYPSTHLSDTIVRIVGESTLVKDLERPIVIPAVNLTKGGPKVFKTGHHARLILDWRLKVRDVALATSAAPTYFPAHRIDNELFADGGVFANSPDFIALHEAENFLNVVRTDLTVLSIGTTTTDFAVSSSLDPRMGVMGWMRNQRLTDIMIGSQQALTNDMMKHVLGDRYLRIDRRQGDEQRAELALDCATPSAISNLLSIAHASLAENAANELLRSMLDHKAPPFTFINADL